MSNQKQTFGERVYIFGLFECPKLSFQNGRVLTIVADLDKRLLPAGEPRQKINFTARSCFYIRDFSAAAL